jgi:hypothetical protein
MQCRALKTIGVVVRFRFRDFLATWFRGYVSGCFTRVLSVTSAHSGNDSFCHLCVHMVAGVLVWEFEASDAP